MRIKKMMISTVLASVVFGSSLLAQSNLNDKEIVKSNKIAVEKGMQNALTLQKTLVKEAIKSLELATNAAVELNKNNTSVALKNIEKALGKLEVILSSKNAPKELPIASNVGMVEFLGSVEQIKKTVNVVKKLLNQNKIQEARRILNTLQSEIDIEVVSLPLTTYPEALKLAAKYITENKIEKAKQVLNIALNTFDNKTTIIPLPLIKATNLINISEQLSKQGKKEEALKYLKAAEEELYRSEALGYLSHSSNTYRTLHKAIEKVRKEIKGKNKAEKLFDELKRKLKDFKEKIFSK
jgi:tetratricopeptide (TPR) repeat protein